MKRKTLIIAVAVFAGIVAIAKQQQPGFIVEHEKDIAKEEPGPHKGGGSTTAYKFFAGATNSKLQFTKRVLHKGAAIGYHLQKEEEIYYIVAGKGIMTMNGEKFNVSEGDGILTLPGSSHGLQQDGDQDLVIIINYEKK